jgi:ABC-type antimicrobial peptide transport system permease subunit
MALGAAPAMVRAMILRQASTLTLVGGMIGLAAALALGRFAEALLFRMNGWDGAVLSFSTIFLATVALVAGLVPAIRASRVDPMTALRCE